MARTRALVSSLGAFLVSSNGLASGNSFLEALASALYEVVERDGVACHRIAWDSGTVEQHHVPLEQLGRFPTVASIIEMCNAAGVTATVYDCTVDTDVPTYLAYVHDVMNGGTGIYRGYGAHLDVEIAIVRAITEALQGRLNFIAGSRDDIFRSAYWRTRCADLAAFAAAVARESGAESPAITRASRATPSFEGDIHIVISRLVRCGIKHVIVVDLTPADFSGHVVRVVVPGLEGYMHYGYRPGARALRYAKRVI
jgi:ribosomal protein S12 methylthiotransferase accessory factor